MEFHEKLQTLRKQKGWTQEELAQKLYVSRTAVSKWESGRGYPNIDSLKAIAVCFSVTVDDLLSGDEVLSIADEDSREKQESLRNRVFGLLDLSALSLLFFRLFAQRMGGMVQEVSLLSLSAVAPYMKMMYVTVVLVIALFGSMTLTLQNYRGVFWMRYKHWMSLLLSVVGVLLFILSPQPYVAFLLFVLLLIKLALLLKRV